LNEGSLAENVLVAALHTCKHDCMQTCRASNAPMQHISTIWITGMVEVINMLSHTGAILWVTHGVCGAQGAHRLTTSMYRPSTDAAHPRTT